jgi:hypothetical protein
MGIGLSGSWADIDHLKAVKQDDIELLAAIRKGLDDAPFTKSRV